MAHLFLCDVLNSKQTRSEFQDHKASKSYLKVFEGCHNKAVGELTMLVANRSSEPIFWSLRDDSARLRWSVSFDALMHGWSACTVLVQSKPLGHIQIRAKHTSKRCCN